MAAYTTCGGLKADGNPCMGPAIKGSAFCRLHQPEGEVLARGEKVDVDIDYEKAKARRDKKREERAASGAYANQKLVAPKREGYVRRWVNDDGTRLADLEDKGYSFVTEQVSGDENITTTDLGSKKSQTVGKKADGTPLTAYLMEMPKKWQDEDSQEKEAARQEVESQIKRGQYAGDGDPINKSRLYNPSEGGNLLDPG